MRISAGNGGDRADRMRKAWATSFRAGMMTIKSTSLSSWGVP
jgi:hypothetical protein